MGTPADKQLPATGSIISKDGAVIGFRQMGRGASVVLVHGGMMAAQNFARLGYCLSQDFTVYIPDRRGRGMSTEGVQEYGLARESEDIQALVQAKGATNIFGLSSGAIIVMQTALIEHSLKKVAIYEPPLPFDNRPTAWVPAYDHAMQQGNYGAAMAAVLKGTGDKGFFSLVPRFVLTALFNLAIKEDIKKTSEGKVTLKTLIGAMYHDIKVVQDAKAILEKYKEIKADVLLLGGDKSREYLTADLGIINAGLPNAKRITFKGIGHIAADNNGKPESVAKELKLFFKS
jgi:pimeloyl-ACP methyl ester carboxylesterase